nr:hypothetical protein Iba_chr09aCG10930 [Ipomoea batatas]GME10041.1 hypothetical protein Iba_scaffold9380CG0090 [Ipomoea batatas]
MASGKETAPPSSSMGEGTEGSQKAAEGVAPPPSSPLPVPQPAPVEARDEEMVVAEDNGSPPPLENKPDANQGVEGDAPPEAVQEGGNVVVAGEIAPAGQAGDFTCEICGARPPTFTMEEFAEYQEHLVKSEEEQLREIEAEERAAAGERVVLDVDLNEEVAPVEELILPDLNLPPPGEE